MRQNQTNGREKQKKNTLHAKLENQKHNIRTERKLTEKSHPSSNRHEFRTQQHKKKTNNNNQEKTNESHSHSLTPVKIKKKNKKSRNGRKSNQL